MLEQAVCWKSLRASTHVILGWRLDGLYCRMGVSYRLLTMFMLAPEPAKTVHLVWTAGVSALALLGFTTVFTHWGYEWTDIALMVALVLGVTSIGLYAHDGYLWREKTQNH